MLLGRRDLEAEASQEKGEGCEGLLQERLAVKLCAAEPHRLHHLVSAQRLTHHGHL